MSSISEIVQIGRDVSSVKYYWAALSTMLFYDYFLTLQDEVRYVWKGKKSWAFAIFFLNRYLPIAYAIWIVATNLSSAFTYEACTKTVFIEVFFFVWCTMIAQVVLNARLYALTMKNKIITGLFVGMSVTQFSFGLRQAALSPNEPVQKLPSINLAAYQLCVFTRHHTAEIIYTAISLCYDLLAFFVIVFFAAKPAFMSSKVPRILRTIIQDATVYFLVIFTSHSVFEMMLLFARPNLQLLPGSGNYVFLPVMINRLMLSLKKAADPSKTAWSLTSLTHTSDLGSLAPSSNMRFAPVSRGLAV